MAERDDGPQAIGVSHIVTPDWTLTNVIWKPDPGMSGQPETGVRYPGDGAKNFHLIQHGWWQWGMATVVIANRLQHGWDCCRISDFMDRCRERRRWPYLTAKARIA